MAWYFRDMIYLDITISEAMNLALRMSDIIEWAFFSYYQ